MKIQLIFDMDDVELGYYFFQRRECKKLTIQELSKLAKVSRQFISEFENGKRISANIVNVRKLSQALNLELKYCLLK